MVKFENVREDKKKKKNKKNYDNHQKYRSNSSENSPCSETENSFDRNKSFRNSSIVEDKYSRNIQQVNTESEDDSVENLGSRSRGSIVASESRAYSTEASVDQSQVDDNKKS